MNATAPRSRLARVLTTHTPLWLTLLFLLAFVGALLWNTFANEQAAARLANERATANAQAEQARTEHAARLRAAVVRDTDQARLQFGMALAWAVRSELIRSNLDQIDQFFSEIVNLPGTEYAILAGADDKILLSTDRRHQGRSAVSVVGAAVIAAPKVSLSTGENGQRLLAIPILGLNNRLGTVVVASRPAAPLAGL